jgi:hypothetical protein
MTNTRDGDFLEVVREVGLGKGHDAVIMRLGTALVQIFRLPIFARLDELKAARWRGF